MIGRRVALGVATDEASAHDMDKAWRQMMRLARSMMCRIASDFQVEQKRERSERAVLLQVRVRDNKFSAADNASVVVAG